ncbi:MAG: hypothetical protein BWZ10_02826 [candidate division BRC1 bacterium ADurb.BinA364]|nr:MAG: hypothetical protein BWZ10_02826 [candidate division BRC1 bacterium ADurb.BinA364]
MEALRNATPEQIETFLRNRKGGQIDEEKIQELIRRFQAGEFNP